MFLPVVIRELSVRARQTSMYYVRGAAAALIGLVIALAMVIVSLFGGIGARPIGAELLQGFTMLLLLYVLMEGLRQAAGGISQERREGTLGFLFLTDLSSLDVLLGKLSGAALHTLYTLLATLPFAGLALLFGGVTGGEFFRSILTLLAALALALGSGTWASVRCRDGMAAVAVATALLLASLVLPLALEAAWQHYKGVAFEINDARVGLFSPLAAFTLASDLNQRVGVARFWWSLLAQAALATLLVADAARRLRGLWRRDEDGSRAARPTRRTRTGRGDFEALVARTLAARVHLNRWLVGLAALTCVAHVNEVAELFVPQPGGTGGLGNIATTLPSWLAELACALLFVHLATRIFADARQSGEMEILLTTRLDNEELVRLLWRTLRPAVFCLAALDILFEILGLVHTSLNFPAGTAAELRWGLLLTMLCQSVSYALNWVALTWSAMWFGIASRRAANAVAKAFGLEIGIAVGSAIGGGIAALILQLLIGKYLPGWAPFFGALGSVPALLIHLGVNCYRLHWARALLRRWFRLAAAGWDL